VLTTHDRDDLERLNQFAESMSGCPTSLPASRVAKLAAVFVSVATAYIESREQEANNPQIEPQKSALLNAQQYPGNQFQQQTTAYPMPTWAPIDPFLQVLGFADDPSLNMDGALGSNASLESWFNGNQQIMELLEDDLMYLDPTPVMF
jgi:hypothetical protein